MCEQARSIAVMIENSLSIAVTVNLQQFQVNQFGGNPQPQKLSIFERFIWQGSIKAKREQERSVVVMIENWLSIFALIPFSLVVTDRDSEMRQVQGGSRSQI
jgi:hypothetical protein